MVSIGIRVILEGRCYRLTGENIWSKINSALKESLMEVATVPSTNRDPKWFVAYIDKDVLYVDNAKDHKPSTNMSQPRKISKKDFLTVYNYYYRWAQGERNLRQEVRLLSPNVAYIFGLIARFE